MSEEGIEFGADKLKSAEQLNYPQLVFMQMNRVTSAQTAICSTQDRRGIDKFKRAVQALYDVLIVSQAGQHNDKTEAKKVDVVNDALAKTTTNTTSGCVETYKLARELLRKVILMNASMFVRFEVEDSV